MIILQTERMILRPWLETDLKPFCEMNADPRVMEFFPALKTYEETTQEYNRILAHFEKYGWGFWAAALKDSNAFVGFVGIFNLGIKAHFTPAVEIGWRLAHPYWNKGYATEGALASLKYGFDSLNLPEIVAYTTVKNMRSRSVMEKIGMSRNPKEDFNHPNIPIENPVHPCVLYRINKEEWEDD